MSLIYDALTDLEKRHADQRKDPVSSTDANGAMRSSNRRSYNFLVFFGIVFSCYLAISSIQINTNAKVPFVGAVTDTQNIEGTAANSDVQGAHIVNHDSGNTHLVAKKQAKNTSLNSRAADGNLQNRSLQDGSDISISTDYSPTGSRAKIDGSSIEGLLAKAEKAYSKQRYSVPESDNAVRYYTEVLVLEPNNERALIGLRNIADAYLRLFEKAMMQGNNIRAALMKERLISAIDVSEWARYEPMLAEIENEYPQRVNASVDELQKPSGVGLVNIRKSKHQIEDELLNNIAGLIFSRNIDAAQKIIVDELSNGNLRVASFKPLIAEFIEREQYLQAIDLLSALPKSDVLFTHSYALSIQAEQGDEAALSFLQTRYSYDEQAGAMYAGLLQKYERYSLAADVYHKLTQQNRTNALYWLGLAVSLENIGQSGSAKGAYEKSLSLGGHANSIKRFIQQRIRSISTDGQHVELSQW